MLKKVIKYSSSIILILTFAIIMIIGYYGSVLPETFNVLEDDNLFLNIFPFSVCVSSKVSPTNLNISENRSIQNCKTNYPAKLKLLNILPIKTVQVNVIPKRSVIPCGTPFGVKIYTQGVMIIEISDVVTNKGLYSPAKISGLQKGDIITKINDKNIYSNEDLEEILQNSQGENINLSITRNEENFETSLKPLKSCDDDKYRAGIWVRDSSAGIGTLTFVDPTTQTFAGLGH